MIQTPIKGAFQGLLWIIIVVVLQGLLWSFGLHGAFVLSPITEPTLLTVMDENIKALEAHQVIPNIVTKPFLDVFVNIGGVGMTIGLILSLVPGGFNINEPLMFGLPVVLNPIYTIPLICVPIICLVIAYLATAAILSILLIVLSVILYMPFVIAANNMKEEY